MRHKGSQKHHICIRGWTDECKRNVAPSEKYQYNTSCVIGFVGPMRYLNTLKSIHNNQNIV